MSKFYIANYARISTEESRQEDITSIEAQLEDNEEFIKKFQNLFPYPVKQFYEQKSGVSLKGRKELLKVIRDIKEGICKGLVVHKVDRLTRNMENAGYLVRILKKYGVEFRSCSEPVNLKTPAGRMIFYDFIKYAVFELERGVERSMRVVKKKWDNGKVIQRPPYGYAGIKKVIKGKEKIVNWVINEEEANKVREVVRLLKLGHSDTSAGEKAGLTRKQVSRIRKNITYTGKAKYNGQVIDSKDLEFPIPVLISEEDFQAIQK